MSPALVLSGFQAGGDCWKRGCRPEKTTSASAVPGRSWSPPLPPPRALSADCRRWYVTCMHNTRE